MPDTLLVRSSHLQPLSYTIKTAASVVGLSERTLATLISDGRLASVRVGRRRLIPADALKDLLAAAAR
jgi:excisionase family DNA binding protein